MAFNLGNLKDAITMQSHTAPVKFVDADGNTHAIGSAGIEEGSLLLWAAETPPPAGLAAAEQTQVIGPAPVKANPAVSGRKK
jgi:hypothetical protein